MPSKDVLKEAIKAFDGTAIIVSHDREFLDGLVTKVFEFGGGKVVEHIGGIYDYLRVHNAETIHEALGVQASSPVAHAQDSIPDKAGGKQSYLDHKEQQKKIRKASREVEESEKKISKMEARIKELDQLFMSPENASNMELVTEYTSTKEALDKENDHWLELSEKLEHLQKEV